MKRISVRGIHERRRWLRHASGADCGYVLVEALLFIAVLTIGFGAILSEIAAGTRELRRHVELTAGLVEAENELAIDRVSDLRAQ